jgi:hypothetical protein
MSDYWGSQAEKREVIANDRDCFRTRAEADAALEASGRFKRQNETTVVGATPSAQYPQQPSGPWGGDNPVPAGGELDYFGQDINEVEPVLEERRGAPGPREEIVSTAKMISSQPTFRRRF